jgi:hypothetical protein
MRRRVLTCALVIAAAAGVTGCGNEKAKKDSPVPAQSAGPDGKAAPKIPTPTKGVE